MKIADELRQLDEAITEKEISAAVAALYYVPPAKDDGRSFKTCDFTLDNQHMRDRKVLP